MAFDPTDKKFQADPAHAPDKESLWTYPIAEDGSVSLLIHAPPSSLSLHVWHAPHLVYQHPPLVWSDCCSRPATLVSLL
jgi:hypothetical protein